MKVKTKAYGVIDVDERQKLFFPFGLFGFENLKNFVLFDATQKPFFWLQSLDVTEIAFVLINPRVFRQDYTLEVTEEELAEIGIESPEEILDFAIVTIPENTMKMTANLQGPVVINKRTKMGRQCISSNPAWKIRHPILEELAGMEKKTC
ncbi:MAG: flagellar assembly protein FliW [Spirochaetales bacterium]|nr:flagellar assembly protein FliW [Spirochaetales bacterium]